MEENEFYNFPPCKDCNLEISPFSTQMSPRICVYLEAAQVNYTSERCQFWITKYTILYLFNGILFSIFCCGISVVVFFPYYTKKDSHIFIPYPAHTRDHLFSLWNGLNLPKHGHVFFSPVIIFVTLRLKFFHLYGISSILLQILAPSLSNQ